MIDPQGIDKNGIEHIRFYGHVGRDELIATIQFIFELESKYDHLIALYDFREAKVILDIADLDSIKDSSRRKFNQNTFIRCAFLTSSPEQAAFGIYYKLDNPQENIAREVFSNREKAIDWLLKK